MLEVLVAFLLIILGSILWIVTGVYVFQLNRKRWNYVFHFIGGVLFLVLTSQVFISHSGGFQFLWSGDHYGAWIPCVVIWLVHAISLLVSVVKVYARQKQVNSVR